jgi:cell wall-associated NlpC family hydrolase
MSTKSGRSAIPLSSTSYRDAKRLIAAASTTPPGRTTRRASANPVGAVEQVIDQAEQQHRVPALVRLG